MLAKRLLNCNDSIIVGVLRGIIDHFVCNLMDTGINLDQHIVVQIFVLGWERPVFHIAAEKLYLFNHNDRVEMGVDCPLRHSDHFPETKDS